MNVQEFFENIRHEALSDQQKHRIYARFLRAHTTTTLLTRIRYYAKVTVFVMATVTIFGLFFSTYYQEEGQYDLTDINEAMLTFQPREGGRFAQAEDLGEIINIQGKIAVYKGDKLIPAETLQDGDIVVLQPSARVEITLLDGVKATIAGPAEFMIRDMGSTAEKGHIYILHLLKGNSVHVISLPEAQENDDADADDTATQTLIVKTPQVEVEQPNISDDVDLTIDEQAGVQTVINEGSDVIVKQIVDGSEIKTVIETDMAAVIEEEKVLIAQTIDDVVSESLRIRYEMGDSEQGLSEDEAETGSVSVPTTVITKKVMSDESLRTLERSVLGSSLQRHIQDMMFQYLVGNSNAYDIARANVVGVLERSALVVAYPGAETMKTELGTIADQIDLFAVFLQETYFITPDIIASLQSASESVRFITVFSLGAYGSFTGSYEMLIDEMRTSEEILVPSLLLP